MWKGVVTIFFMRHLKARTEWSITEDYASCTYLLQILKTIKCAHILCQHIPGVKECEQTQLETCREIVKKLGKDLNVSRLWPYTPRYPGQVAQSLHACFPSLKQEYKSLFLCLPYLFMLQSPRKGSGDYFQFEKYIVWKSPRPQMMHWCEQ